MTPISPNTQAILLLTAPLLLERGTSGEAPLTIKEYNRLAHELRSLEHQPADLLGNDAASIVRSCGHFLDDTRLRRLLERGFLLSHSVERWSSRAIWVISRADASYPRRLKTRLKDLAPPILYGCGEPDLLNHGGLAIVGSRNISDALVRYSEEVGRLTAQAERQVISGAARGVDESAMRGALGSGGRVVGVYAESLEKASTNRDNRNAIRAGNLILVSPYDPMAGFNVGNAMQRNKLIYAFADAALVVNSDLEKGGTWAGAIEQLEKYRFVRVYVRSTGEDNEGLRALQAEGARPWPNPNDAAGLRDALAALPDAGDTNQQSELPLAPREGPNQQSELPLIAREAAAPYSAYGSAPTTSRDPLLEQKTKAAIDELANLLRALPNDSYRGFLDGVLIDPLVKAIQDPQERIAHQSLGDFFMSRRDRLAFAERLRLALQRAYAFQARSKEGRGLFLSVSAQQWFDDGVIHTEGERPHEGIMLVLQDRRIKVATIARDPKRGDELGPEDFNFIDLDEANTRQRAMTPNEISNIEQPLRDLESLIARREGDETRYQELFEAFPWILGAEYTAAFRHQPLDDKNVPDFLARRSRDGRYDIIEIKSPFLEISRRDGSPNAACKEAIAQSERYLDFARNNAPYLEQRRLSFDAPKCWLIAGYDVSEGVHDEFKRKQRLNPALHILTYNDLLIYVQQTVELIRHLRDGWLRTTASP